LRPDDHISGQERDTRRERTRGRRSAQCGCDTELISTYARIRTSESSYSNTHTYYSITLHLTRPRQDWPKLARMELQQACLCAANSAQYNIASAMMACGSLLTRIMGLASCWLFPEEAATGMGNYMAVSNGGVVHCDYPSLPRPALTSLAYPSTRLPMGWCVRV
jgi:hypothetical protein